MVIRLSNTFVQVSIYRVLPLNYKSLDEEFIFVGGICPWAAADYANTSHECF